MIDLLQLSFPPLCLARCLALICLINWFSSITFSHISYHQDKDEHFYFTKSSKGYKRNLPKITQCVGAGRQHRGLLFSGLYCSHQHLREYEKLDPIYKGETTERREDLKMAFNLNYFSLWDLWGLPSLFFYSLNVSLRKREKEGGMEGGREGGGGMF